MEGEHNSRLLVLHPGIFCCYKSYYFRFLLIFFFRQRETFYTNWSNLTKCWSNGTPKGYLLTLSIFFVVSHETFGSCLKSLYIPLFLHLSKNLKPCFKGIKWTWAATRAPPPPSCPARARRGLGPYTIFFGGIFEMTDCVWAVVILTVSWLNLSPSLS